ncbi:hypothetical protein Mapa_017524 [Marchantia paleacea]|nr:hypothetical protein Mapa_017524 [Marchantia paleacea]
MNSTSRSTMRNRFDVLSSNVSEEVSAHIDSNYNPFPVRKRRIFETALESRKLTRPTSSQICTGSGFDVLPEDLIFNIFKAVISSASSPADFASTLLTCKRFNAAGTHHQVLVHASSGALAVKASSWSDHAYNFLKRCADAGNIEACYTLGMIRFYCLNNRGGGASLMAKAAMQSHAAALHSLAVIQFNGSGGTRKDKDLKAGVALCVRAATLGHVDAMRELGHCLQDGYGVLRNLLEGRRLLLEANAREAAAAVVANAPRLMETAFQLSPCSTVLCPEGHMTTSSSMHNSFVELGQRAVLDHARSQLREGLDRTHVYKLLQGGGSCSLLSDFGCTVPPPKLHIANKFLVDWFDINPPASGLRLCSHGNCGRPETRRHEFRRCSACGCVNYCSRACQALDWKIRHKYDCQPVADWGDRDDPDQGAEEDEQVVYEDMDDS